jgi:hypothetical protein
MPMITIPQSTSRRSSKCNVFDAGQRKLTARRTVIEGLKDLPFAPSAQTKEIPNRSLGDRLGLGLDELNDPEDDVETRVKSAYPLFVKC